jgi:hypothetical protein
VGSLGRVTNALNVLTVFEHEKVVEALFNAFRSLDKRDTQRYTYLLFAMGDTGDTRFVQILVDALKDPRSEIRSAVPFRIAFIADPQG